jgi:eukaryotic-like serine/threonine-protein kinase
MFANLNGWQERLFGGLLGGGIVGLFVGLPLWLVGLKTGLTAGDIAIRSFLNEGIKRSMRNGLIGGLGVGLANGLANGVGNGLGVGLCIGLPCGSATGGRACLHHFALRLVLWYNNFAPLNYIGFLDYAAVRIFLRKVGGGYVFVHRLLLEYFAARHQTSTEQQK